MGAMSFAVRNALAAHPVETLRPGDAILLNDPLLGSGHLPDFFITQPAFHDGALIGFAVNILHHTDVGGQRPGSQGVEGIFDYFQEGLRIPPTKVWKEYQEQEGVVGIIAANTRTPDKVLGDLRAQRSALRVGELRLQELAARYGRDDARRRHGRDHRAHRGEHARGHPRDPRRRLHASRTSWTTAGPAPSPCASRSR